MRTRDTADHAPSLPFRRWWYRCKFLDRINRIYPAIVNDLEKLLPAWQACGRPQRWGQVTDGDARDGILRWGERHHLMGPERQYVESADPLWDTWIRNTALRTLASFERGGHGWYCEVGGAAESPVLDPGEAESYKRAHADYLKEVESMPFGEAVLQEEAFDSLARIVVGPMTRDDLAGQEDALRDVDSLEQIIGITLPEAPVRKEVAEAAEPLAAAEVRPKKVKATPAMGPTVAVWCSCGAEHRMKADVAPRREEARHRVLCPDCQSRRPKR